MENFNNKKLFLSSDEQNKLNLLFLEGSSVRRAAILTHVNHGIVAQYFHKLGQSIHAQAQHKSKVAKASVNAEYFHRITGRDVMHANSPASFA